MNQPYNDEYVYKYSGELATYCVKHQPVAVYSEKADKKGYVGIFSTSHGTSRPCSISRNSKPYDIEKFERIVTTEIENGIEK